MYSISIDYLFNRVYDILLWIKYVWLFVILRTDPQDYLDTYKDREWDGLRDRGWFDVYLENKKAAIPPSDVHVSFWQSLLEKMGFNLKIAMEMVPDISDSSPYDSYNLTIAQVKERYQQDYYFFISFVICLVLTKRL
jgi:hypothetical protein